MTQKIRPLYDRVLVQRLDAEEKTKGGIIIPDTAKEKGQMGLVIAVGTGRVLKDGAIAPLQVKAGDKILFGKYCGTEVDDQMMIIREDEILAIVE